MCEAAGAYLCLQLSMEARNFGVNETTCNQSQTSLTSELLGWKAGV